MSDQSVPSSGIEALVAQAHALISDLEAKKVEYEKSLADFHVRSVQQDELWKNELGKIQSSEAEIRKNADESSRLAGEILSSATSAIADSKSVSDTKADFAKIQSEIESTQQDVKQKLDTLSGDLTQIGKTVASFDEQKKALEATASESSKARVSIDKDREVATESLEVILNTKKSSEDLVNQVTSSLAATDAQQKELSSTIENLRSEISKLEEEKAALSEALTDIKGIKGEIDAAKTTTTLDSQSVSESKNAFDALKTEAQAAHDDLVVRRGQAVEKIAEIDSTFDRIKQERDELIEDRSVDGTTVRSIGNNIRDLNTEFRQYLAEVRQLAENDKEARDKLASTSEENWTALKEGFVASGDGLVRTAKADFDKLKESLQTEIRQLLPGAGAAGLAWAYYDAKTMYGPGKFEFEGKKGDKNYYPRKFASWILHVLQYRTARFMFYLMFLGPLLLVAYYFYDLMQFMLKNPKSFNINLVLFRTLISLPLATVSLFGWSSIRLYRRLYEEYNHKQRVMQLYESFKRELGAAGTDEQRKALLTIMLATVGDKPTLAMHNYDKPLEIQWPTFAQLLGIGATDKPTPPTNH